MSHNGPRDYNAAVAALNSLQSNFSIVEALKKRGPGWNKQALPEMRDWVRRIGYEVCVRPYNISMDAMLMRVSAIRFRPFESCPHSRH